MRAMTPRAGTDCRPGVWRTGTRFAFLAAALALAAGPAVRAYGQSATGGVVAQDGYYWIHTFTSNTTFVVSRRIVNVEWLIVGGGGAVLLVYAGVLAAPGIIA